MKKFVKMLVSSAVIGAMAFGMCACTQTTPTQAPTAAPTDGTTAATEAPTDAPAADGLIKVGIINNDPNESGYRTANDRGRKHLQKRTAMRLLSSTALRTKTRSQQLRSSSRMK